MRDFKIQWKCFIKLYVIEFNEDGTMKNKKYLLDGVVGREFRRPIIVITYDECTFPANDDICKAYS